jgi:hypothetical protein
MKSSGNPKKTWGGLGTSSCKKGQEEEGELERLVVMRVHMLGRDFPSPHTPHNNMNNE